MSLSLSHITITLFLQILQHSLLTPEQIGHVNHHYLCLLIMTE